MVHTTVTAVQSLCTVAGTSKLDREGWTVRLDEDGWTETLVSTSGSSRSPRSVSEILLSAFGVLVHVL
ncbi:hypothetical protein Ddye_014596 [Dipteronia dyeriana]|uniref:Uncharacterized protein n=1 Tax=Dipteronia dyeriana TaxID=168575 RepID=A0AAD9X8K0_9ROSI|nr:hypothetical protein Ddye_014596 [Dipteronia dyeriana]